MDLIMLKKITGSRRQHGQFRPFSGCWKGKHSQRKFCSGLYGIVNKFLLCCQESVSVRGINTLSFQYTNELQVMKLLDHFVWKVLIMAACPEMFLVVYISVNSCHWNQEPFLSMTCTYLKKMLVIYFLDFSKFNIFLSKQSCCNSRTLCNYKSFIFQQKFWKWKCYRVGS